MTGRGSSIYTREFVLLNVVLCLASAVMALFFSFHEYLLSLGIDPRWHGFLIGADAVTGIVVQPLLSPYLHGGNAKKIAAAGICLMAVSLALYNFALTVPTIASVRILHGTGFILLVAAIISLFASYIPPQRSGESLGIISITRLIPYAVIPPAVVFFVGRSCSFISIVTVAAGIAVFFLLPLACVRLTVTREGREKTLGFKGLTEDLTANSVRRVLAVNLVFYSAYTSLFYFFRDFGAARGMKNPGFFFTFAMAAMIIIRLAGSRYFDRVRKAQVSAACMAILAVCHIILSFSAGSTAFLVLAAAFGVLWGVSIPLLMAFLFDISEARFRGLNMNLSLVMMQAGFFLGPLVGGLILARWGYVMLFIFCGFLNAAGAAMLVLPPGFRAILHDGDSGFTGVQKNW